MHRTLDTKLGIILFAFLVSQGALAGTIRKWTDENGDVVFGDVPVQGGTERVKVYCGGSCSPQVKGIEVKERISPYMDGPNCKFQYLKDGDAVGKNLALAAKQECATNKAMQDMDPNYTPKHDAYDRLQVHSAPKRGTRDSAVDRAGYRQEQMPNRQEARRAAREAHERIQERWNGLKSCLKGYSCN